MHIKKALSVGQIFPEESCARALGIPGCDGLLPSCALQIILLCPNKPQAQPLLGAAINSSLRVWETRLEAAPGARPWLPQQGELAALGIGDNREGKAEGAGKALEHQKRKKAGREIIKH